MFHNQHPEVLRIASAHQEKRHLRAVRTGDEWRCQSCGKLLGVDNGRQMHIRLKHRQEYLVSYPVTATCPGCGTLNVKTGN